MGVKITELPALSGNPSGGDYFVVSDSSVTSKLDYSLLAQAIIQQYKSALLGSSALSIQGAFSLLSDLPWKNLGQANQANPVTATLNSNMNYLLVTVNGSSSVYEDMNSIWVVGVNGQHKIAAGKRAHSFNGFEYRSPFAAYATGNTAKRDGNVVSVHAALKNTKAIAVAGDIACILPEGFRPAIQHRFIQQATGTNNFLVTVETNGQVKFDRFGTTSATTASEGTQWNIDCTFIAPEDNTINVSKTNNVISVSIPVAQAMARVYMLKMNPKNTW